LHVRRFVAEIAVAGLFRTMQRFRVEENIDAVTFEYGAPEYHREYVRFFNDRVRFDQAFTGLRFDSRLLLAAGPFPDAQLHQTLTAFAKRRIMHLTNCLPYAARVHECLVWQPPPRDMTMRTVACALGVSERSLRRRLAEEGKPYPKLVNEALAFIAKTCLLDERRTIAETALELGFADNTTFHRAFKRWTGLTPSEYRARQTATVNDTGAGPTGPATTTRA
jgi:AraC-like DNA-binding protein